VERLSGSDGQAWREGGEWRGLYLKRLGDMISPEC
jgi:hypothetical protein